MLSDMRGGKYRRQNIKTGRNRLDGGGEKIGAQDTHTDVRSHRDSMKPRLGYAVPSVNGVVAKADLACKRRARAACANGFSEAQVESAHATISTSPLPASPSHSNGTILSQSMHLETRRCGPSSVGTTMICMGLWQK